MNPLRRQLPVRSPLSASDALAGLSGADLRFGLATKLEALYGQTAHLTESGTTALTLALRIAKGRRDAPIAMPAYACFDLATAALGAGVRVRLYDLDPHTLRPNDASLARAIGTDASAVVIVHLYGVPVPLEPVRELAARADALLIEDAAQGTGAVLNGRAVGGGGDLGVLSFGRGKGVTGGGGGALLVSDALRAEAQMAVRGLERASRSSLSLTARTLAQWLLARPAFYGVPSRIPFLQLGETLYHAPSTPRAMHPAMARVLMRTLPAATAEAERRRAHAEQLRETQRTNAPETLIELAPNVTPGFLRLPMLLAPNTRPSRQSAAALGIMPAYPIPLSRLEPFVPTLLDVTPLPGAESLAQRLWTLPTHGALTAVDLHALREWISTHGRSSILPPASAHVSH